MKYIKCSNCGLVSFETQTTCKRCGKTILNQNASLTASSKLEGDFTHFGSSVFKDLTEKNREFGFQVLAFGIFCSILPWVWTFVFGMLSAKLVWASIIGGPTFVVLGIGVIVSPPKSKLNADENKPRNGILILIGLILGLVEAYLFNKVLGLW